LVKIFARKFGHVEDEIFEYIKCVMEECYQRLEPHDISYVDLYLFENASSMRSFFLKEKSLLGVSSYGFEETFTAQHDAWRGTSRISICLEKLRALSKEVQVGTIRHEVGHSVLHGSIEFYLIPITLVERAAAKVPEELARNFLYLVSIAVKDYEVSRLLSRKGYVEDQIAYAVYSISADEEDKLAWRLSEKNRVAKAMCILSRLKEVCCIAPFLEDKRFEDMLHRHLARSLNYMGGQTIEKLLLIATKCLPKLGDDTTKNVEILSDIALKAFL
jgi:hypothetical protein